MSKRSIARLLLVISTVLTLASIIAIPLVYINVAGPFTGPDEAKTASAIIWRIVGVMAISWVATFVLFDIAPEERAKTRAGKASKEYDDFDLMVPGRHPGKRK